MKFIKTLSLIFLAIHLFTVHSKLLYHANPDNPDRNTTDFSFMVINEQTVLAMVVSLAYSIITVALITIFANKKEFLWIILWFALLDGFGVFIYYGMPNYLFGAFYYALYTFSIIVCFGWYRYDEVNDVSATQSIKKKFTQREIAKQYGVSESLVSQIFKKKKNA